LDEKFTKELRGFLRHLVGVAAATTVPYFRSDLPFESKSQDGFDPVTVADRATEEAIRGEISARYPDHGIIGEEFAPLNPDAPYQWVIDPIDGTKAFICGLPTWATLVGLCDATGPLVGLMSQPIVGEYFIGGFGQVERVGGDGATNLTTSDIVSLANASVFATSPDMFSVDDELPKFQALSQQVRLTRYGTDSYAYCMLAAGHIDIVAEAGLGFYDVAALIPIVETAGGVITDWTGFAVRGGGTVLAAANSELHETALAALNSQ
jgi:histidinol phosphatase-like enzyme (inositol monophosphatase family)